MRVLGTFYQDDQDKCFLGQMWRTFIVLIITMFSNLEENIRIYCNLRDDDIVSRIQ